MSAALVTEDALRLQVLLAEQVEVVRIDERDMTVRALTPRGEAAVRLHPNCRPEQYLLRVRELLGGHALGSPGGYPVHLRRWTRMGQASDRKLEALLKLGEEEAFVAVAHAPGLTAELARRVWWALPTMDIARTMLENPAVAGSPVGRTLAHHIVEHLAFEEDPDVRLEAIRRVLGAGLADRDTRERLWAMARREPHYHVGFLEYLPDDLPAVPAVPEAVARLAAEIAPLAASNPIAGRLAQACAPMGQAWLAAAEDALQRPLTHDVVYRLLDLIRARFALAGDACAAMRELIELAPESEAMARAVARLAKLTASDAEPVLTRTSAIGPLMRRKLEPVLGPVIADLRTLRAKEA